MRRSKTEIYLHLVWATYRRLPLVRPEIEDVVFGYFAGEARRQGCEVLAIGGMPDHVHLALVLSPRIAVARLVQQIKGVSSTRVRQEVVPGETFGWQDHYAAFSFSRSHRERVLSYIANQKRHHAEGTLWKPWEELGESPDPPVSPRPGA